MSGTPTWRELLSIAIDIDVYTCTSRGEFRGSITLCHK